MMKIVSQIALLISTCLIVLSCIRSEPRQLLVLASTGTASGPTNLPAGTERGIHLGLREIEIPSYLDRKDVVVREDENGLHLVSSLSWAEDLSSGLTRVLSRELEHCPSVRRVASYPWRHKSELDEQLELRVERFEARRGQEIVELTVSYEHSSAAQSNSQRRSLQTACSSDGQVLELAACMSKSLHEFAESLCAELWNDESRAEAQD